MTDFRFHQRYPGRRDYAPQTAAPISGIIPHGAPHPLCEENFYKEITVSAWLRLLFTLTNSLLRQSRLRPDEESTLTFRVWVTGADVSVMNNAKYLTVMEMGRVDLMLRTGFFKLARAKRWASPLASITVQF